MKTSVSLSPSHQQDPKMVLLGYFWGALLNVIQTVWDKNWTDYSVGV